MFLLAAAAILAASKNDQAAAEILGRINLAQLMQMPRKSGYIVCQPHVKALTPAYSGEDPVEIAWRTLAELAAT